MSLTVQAGELVPFDPSDIRVIDFNWADNLGSAAISGSATWTITAVEPASATVPTKDNESILSGNQIAQVRINVTGATANARYNIACKITTNETPSQTKEQSFDILVQNR
jgi:hypothetical protein